MVNPYDAKQHFEVSLEPGDVDGFVFWTKNVGPFRPVLDIVARRGTPFIVQYTINGYPRALESRVVDARRAVEHVRQIAGRFGPKVAVWRYDTILFSTLTDADFHRRNFEKLATALTGGTDEVVVSFMQVYDKTRRNLRRAASEHGFEWRDPPLEEKLALLSDLAAMADSASMKLTMCSQPEHLIEGVGVARCVDAPRLAEIGGREIHAELGGARQACGCYRSRDIGSYDTCPHGCVYCYAVRNRRAALRGFEEHDPRGEYLTPTAPPPRKKQLLLFPE